MKTVIETLQGGAEYFDKHGVESGRLNMEQLLAHVLGCDRMQLYLEFDRPLEEGELAPLRKLVKRRAEGEPLQHILGTVEFCGREFKCDARALIPRPETEELVAALAKRIPGDGGAFLDMGTGSGVIGLTLAVQRPGARVTLADTSAEALELARENAALLGIPDGAVNFVEGDLFERVEGAFRVIIANLPYIAGEEIERLAPEVQRDPRTALDGGQSGTEIIERFIESAGSHLESGGEVALEVGGGQTGQLSGSLEKAGFEEVEIGVDYSGVERFLFAKKGVD